jgi:predicted outer membrane repeat protein
MGEECEISDTIFTECTAEYGDGGAVYANGKANATGSVFTNNVADNLGGAIYNCMHSDCVFESNTEPEIYFDEEFRQNLTMTIDVSDVNFGEDIIVLVHVEPSVSLNATAVISGTAVISDTIKVFEIVNGTGILNISGLNAGTYELTVTVNSTMEYNSCSNSTMFSVMKVQPVIEIIADDIYYGDDAAILVNLPDGATGMVELYVNGAVINFTINDEGKPSTVIPGLEAGTYYVTASYAGDLNYNGCSNNTTFKVMHNTFSQLQKIIDDDTTGEITLDRDYYGEGSEITISKTITINGNGHTLDAKGLSRIFNVQSGTVVLDNLSLVNGNSDSYGGAAYFQSGSTCTVRNCNFTGNTAKDDGGAVYFYEHGTVTNSTFTANSAKKGGAIYSNGNTDAVNSTFIDNSADLGGAIYNCDYEICTFIGNSQPDFYFDEQYRKNVTMTVNVEEIIEEIMMGEDLTVIIIFDQDITGNVTVNIDCVDMDVPIVNRTGNLLVP